jgi:predicted HTH domain antitoxin
MSLVIESGELDAAGVKPEEARQILAASLYSWGRLSFGRAAKIAGMNRIDFQKFLGSQKIPSGPTSDQIKSEAETLRRLGLL